MVRFAQFTFDPAERRLSDGDRTIDISSRYLDALALLVAQPGKLVTKDRFMDEVWGGVPVTDEALTQAIRSLRKALGDDAANPRFIETVPKHGYRFVAPVDSTGEGHAPGRIASFAIAGASGGAIAGALGGVAYGLGGGASLMAVLVALTAFLGALGGGGIAVGMGIARRILGARPAADIMGAMAGGLVVGALARLFGIDAFTLLLRAAPTAMTGASEGLLLGAAAGIARHARSKYLAAWGLFTGAIAGTIIALVGGRLMAGSLALLDRTVADGRLDLWWADAFAHDATTPLVIVATALEGALFVGLLVLFLARRDRRAT